MNSSLRHYRKFARVLLLGIVLSGVGACTRATPTAEAPTVTEESTVEYAGEPQVFANCNGTPLYTAEVRYGKIVTLGVTRSNGQKIEAKTGADAGGDLEGGKIYAEVTAALEAHYDRQISVTNAQEVAAHIPVDFGTILTVRQKANGTVRSGTIKLPSRPDPFRYTLIDGIIENSSFEPETQHCPGSPTVTPPIKEHTVVLGPGGEFYPTRVDETNDDDRTTAVSVTNHYGTFCLFVTFALGFSGKVEFGKELSRILLDPGVTERVNFPAESELYYCGCENIRSATLTVSIPAGQSWQEATVDVDSRKGWQDSGIQVRSGSTVALTYNSGAWTIDRRRLSETPLVDSGGYVPGAHPIIYDPTRSIPDGTLACRILTDADHGILIARIGDGPPIPIGKARSFISDTSGQLYLSINDQQCVGQDGHDCDSGCQSDNEGSISVSIAVRQSDGQALLPQKGMIAH